MTKKLLDRGGVAYDVVDIQEDESALAYIKELGYLQAPVVVVGDEHWSGFNPEKIKAL